jgi:hypothetical protein
LDDLEEEEEEKEEEASVDTILVDPLENLTVEPIRADRSRGKICIFDGIRYFVESDVVYAINRIGIVVDGQLVIDDDTIVN